MLHKMFVNSKLKIVAMKYTIYTCLRYGCWRLHCSSAGNWFLHARHIYSMNTFFYYKYFGSLLQSNNLQLCVMWCDVENIFQNDDGEEGGVIFFWMWRHRIFLGWRGTSKLLQFDTSNLHHTFIFASLLSLKEENELINICLSRSSDEAVKEWVCKAV